MRSKVFFAAILVPVFGLPLAGTAARAAGFTCTYKEAPNAPKKLPPIQGLEEDMTQVEARRHLADLVDGLQAARIEPALIVDHLVWAYCPLVANDPRLSDAQKTERLRRFAGQVAALAYKAPGTGEIDVLVDLPLPPGVLGLVDSAAKAAEVSRDQWLREAIDRALNKQ